jgi:hypothetical protein
VIYLLKSILVIRWLIGIIALVAFGVILIVIDAGDFLHADFILEFTLDKSAELYSAAITIVATFLSIGLPLSISIISDHIKPFNSKRFYKKVVREPTLILMLAFLVPNGLILYFLAYGVCSKTAVVVTLITTSAFLISFFLFALRMIKYAIDAEEIYEDFLNQGIDQHVNV